jgi:ABC-type glutathione transport system ATPase component
MSGPAPPLRVEGLCKDFGLRRTATERITRSEAEPVRAVDNVSFTLRRGEILGVAGESGSGKTTLARCITRLVEPDAGTIELDGVDVRAARGKDLREVRRRMQMVFQDPYSSLNPRMTVGAALHEAGRVHKRPASANVSPWHAHSSSGPRC